MLKDSVTQNDIDTLYNEAEVTWTTEFDKCTVMTVKLKNGFVLTASSASVFPDNYDENVGVNICKQKIMNKLWELEEYCLQKQIYEAQNKQRKVLSPESKEIYDAIMAQITQNLGVQIEEDGKTEEYYTAMHRMGLGNSNSTYIK
jgi:hypothetical protein